MANERHTTLPAHDRTHDTTTPGFKEDESASTTMAFTIGGVTITLGGILAFLAFGALMSGLRSVPGVGGSFAFVGNLVLLGCMIFFIMLAVREWGS